MTILLDSHVFYWWTTDDPKLSRRAHSAIENGSPVYVSAVVAFEIVNKVRSGRWPGADLLAHRFFDVVARYHFLRLPLSLEHAHLAASLPGSHRDPFDRMLAAQAEIEDLTLVTADPAFRVFGTRVLW